MMSKRIKNIFFDEIGPTFLTGLLSIIFAVVILVVGSMTIARQIDHHYQVSKCKNLSVTLNRPTKFKDYSFWDYQCLTTNPSQPGTWINPSQLVGVK